MKTKFSVILLLLILYSPARATLITIAIEAEVDYVDDPAAWLEGRIIPGDIITGTYTYESTTPDSNPSAYVADYQHDAPTCGIFLSVGGFEFRTDTTNVDFVLEVIDDYTSGGLHDAFAVISYNQTPLSNGVDLGGISWWLTDYSATALSTTALPVSPPLLTDWQSNFLTFGGGTREEPFGVAAHVTSAVPEPATVLLLVIGSLITEKSLIKTSCYYNKRTNETTNLTPKGGSS